MAEDSGQASVLEEIQITPEMYESGRKAYRRIDFASDDVEFVIWSIYRSMRSVEPLGLTKLAREHR